MNYLGDRIITWPCCLRTGLSGCLWQQSTVLSDHADEETLVGDTPMRPPGEARSWGMAIAYFKRFYSAVLHVHQEMMGRREVPEEVG